MGLIELRGKRFVGSVARETYWSQVKNSLEQLNQIDELLANSGAEINLTGAGIQMTYLLSSESRITFIVNPDDTRGIGVSIVSDGRYEEIFERALLAVGRNSKTFLDVGANAGFYSLAMAKSFKECKAIAFEPNPEIAQTLLTNIKINNLKEQITHNRLALSDTSGFADFFVPQFTGTGGGSLRHLHPDEGAPQKFSVSLGTLDSLNLDSVDLMKIDVEGNELSVIRGALETLGRFAPTIFVELLRKWMAPFDAHPQNVVDLLVNLGYKCFEILDDSIAQIESIDDSTISTNFIFVHNSRSADLESLVAFGA